jgi:NADPH-dependent 2,4-dienoyl-CoA reductase/sulfur reductase-like enzyme
MQESKDTYAPAAEALKEEAAPAPAAEAPKEEAAPAPAAEEAPKEEAAPAPVEEAPAEGLRGGNDFVTRMTSNADAKPKILIVGASFGGLGCAHRLIAQGIPGDKADVTILDGSTLFTIGGLWQFCWNGRCSAEATTWSNADMVLPGVSTKFGAESRVVSLDTEARTATLSNGDTLQYDACVLATGCVSDTSAVSGLDEHCLDVCSFEQTTQDAKVSLDAFVAQARDLAAEGSDRKLTFVYSIAKMPYKCPPLPMEVSMLVDEYLIEAGVRDQCRIVLVSPVPWPVGGPKGKACFNPILQDKNIEFLPDRVVSSVVASSSSRGGCTLHFEGGEETVEADLVWGTMPQRAPDFLQHLVDGSGFIPVDFQTNRCTGKITHVDTHMDTLVMHHTPTHKYTHKRTHNKNERTHQRTTGQRPARCLLSATCAKP